MKLITLIFLILLFVIAYSFYRIQHPNLPTLNFPAPTQSITPTLIQSKSNSQQSSESTSASQVIATNLDTPWAIAFLPDRSMLVTERPGRVRLIDSTGNLADKEVSTINSVKEIGEGGLLGIAIHPNFSVNHYVYLYYTYASNGANTFNRVVRMKFENSQLLDETIIVDQIPGASIHNGGRIKFGPDNYLYITTGDANNPSQAQDTTTLGGKILRVTDDGKAADGNPFRNLVFSYGHRNPQGITWDKDGNLWETEHGRSLPTGFDEVNLIESGKNYGWPTIQGDETRSGMVTPLLNSGATTTWAPAGAAIINNSLFFGGLKGESLYQVTIEGTTVSNLRRHFTNQFGRIRDVVQGPDGMLYITTSNQDGRGNPAPDDDKVIKINPKNL